MKRFALLGAAGMLLCIGLPVRGQDAAALPDGPGKERSKNTIRRSTARARTGW